MIYTRGGGPIKITAARFQDVGNGEFTALLIQYRYLNDDDGSMDPTDGWKWTHVAGLVADGGAREIDAVCRALPDSQKAYDIKYCEKADSGSNYPYFCTHCRKCIHGAGDAEDDCRCNGYIN
jgi:hypothetical protein